MQFKLGKNSNMGREGEHISSKENCKYKGSEAETCDKKGQVSGVWCPRDGLVEYEVNS